MIIHTVTKDRMMLRLLRLFILKGMVRNTNFKTVTVCPIYNTSKEDISTVSEDFIPVLSKFLLKPSCSEFPQ